MTETGTRERILHAAARLLSESDGAPLSTRAVCAAAGIGAPTLYHHFGDKDGLLDAVVAYGFERHIADERAQQTTGDPVQDLRRGWDGHVAYGREYPAFYTLMYGTGRRGGAAEEARRILVEVLEKVARAGRLRVPVETAAGMIGAACVGVTLGLISGDRGDPELSPRTREAVLAAVTTDQAADGPSSPSALAVALATALADRAPTALSEAENTLLREWLTRLAGA
ncbi:TetR/AcrR family transcriptional regulator [Actinoallomurus purpureus]|uniref:TetR/AcrR family transcriptional regulator n=1 Tax=Actinoallomurus purpureus TaxID=478114 RepID=UPI002093D217|nr:TetR/AcrR family transcriptional regulator [Actinoallomurus purpureus]MCO6007743.1 TetR/AcrR family transcriptional regulator [Actinoallomurus purpureus]